MVWEAVAFHDVSTKLRYLSGHFLRRSPKPYIYKTWWRHQTETFSAFLAICAGNSPLTSEFLAQRPVTRSFDVFFVLRRNKRLSKQWWGWWFETPSRPLWCHCNVWGLLQYTIFSRNTSLTQASRNLIHNLFPNQYQCRGLCQLVIFYLISE